MTMIGMVARESVPVVETIVRIEYRLHGVLMGSHCVTCSGASFTRSQLPAATPLAIAPDWSRLFASLARAQKNWESREARLYIFERLSNTQPSTPFDTSVAAT